MNLSLYSVQAFVVLDTEGTRVLAKYYRPKSHPQGESKELLTLKDQKAFEKGLWQKTKKAGGAWFFIGNGRTIANSSTASIAHCTSTYTSPQTTLSCTTRTW